MARARKTTTPKGTGASTLIRVPSYWLRPGMIVAAPEYVSDFFDDAEPKIAWQDWPKRYADMPSPMPTRLRVDHFDEDEDGESSLVAIDAAGRELGVSFDWNTGAYPDIFLVEASTIDDLTAAQRRARAYPNPSASELVWTEYPPTSSEGEPWYQTQPFEVVIGTGVIRLYPATKLVGKRSYPVKFGRKRGYDVTYFEIDPSKPERAPGYWHWGAHSQRLAGSPVLLEEGKRIAQLWIDGKNYTVDDGKVSGVLDNPRRGQRGKHVACGSEISDKDCRQIQHVYEAQRARGASKSSAAAQARGSLHHNPTERLANRLARGHNR